MRATNHPHFAWQLLTLVAGALMAGCSATAPTDRYHSAFPHVTSPLHKNSNRIETASWYGPGFDGRRTASGDRFDQNDLTAASKTLPLGSRVRVTNVANGRSVVVRINDRGPYVAGRSIDLSRRAAQRIGIIHRGVAAVTMAQLSEE